MKTKLAVYSYIQALRALGRTELTIREIAENLSIPYTDVFNAVVKLRKHGVRIKV